MKIELGSAAWFERARHSCVDHLRALLSIRIAHDSIGVMLRDWEIADYVIRSALHTTCVISYARPFTSAQTNRGKIHYPTRALKKAPGFDIGLHDHILDLRNRLIAHGDYGVFPSTMYVQAVGDERLAVSLGINVKGMLGIEARDLAQRYERHLRICAETIENALNCECRELAKQARLHPSEFDKTHNIPPEEQEAVLGTTESILPGPSGPAAGVATPAFPEGLSAYHYITLTHQIPLVESGKYTVNVRDVPTEITFTVEDGGKIKQA